MPCRCVFVFLFSTIYYFTKFLRGCVPMASTAQSRIKSISYAKYGYMFIAPFFLVYAFFQVWPLINTFLLSFHGNGGDNQPFVGLENYISVLTNSAFLQTIKNAPKKYGERAQKFCKTYDLPFHAEAFLCVSSCLIFILSPCRKRVACCAEKFTTSYHICARRTMLN